MTGSDSVRCRTAWRMSQEMRDAAFKPSITDLHDNSLTREFPATILRAIRLRAMAKTKSTAGKKARGRRAAPARKPAKKTIKPRAAKSAPAAPKKAAAEIDFNHAMIYSRDVSRAIEFYGGLLGFKVLETFRYEGKAVYARLKAPAGEGTIALHQLGPEAPSAASFGVRLYFQVRDLDEFCDKLKRRGVYFTQPPRMMPWGWRHAYLDDPDSHEISLYWAGENRMKKSVMQAAREARKVPKASRT